MSSKPPEIRCPYCGKIVKWVDNKEVYGKRYGKSYMCYCCKPCDAYVGCHQNSKRPLGTMANKALRTKRMAAHLIVDCFWKSGRYKRGEVYRRLSAEFGETVHIGESDMDRCDKIIEVAARLFEVKA